MVKVVFLLLSFAVCGLECSAQSVSGQVDGHDYVDLGLPSRAKWATCNVGAAKPAENGGYYSWGEVASKTDYSLNSYKWGSAVSGKIVATKYCTKSNFGTVDNKKVLEADDDAAAVNWGSAWRMPTVEEQQELIEGCYWEWVENNGVYWRVGTSKKNGNSIVFPAAGNREEKGLYYAGYCGFYWSATLNEYADGAYYLDFNEDFIDWDNGNRCNGCSIRAVVK